MLEHSCSTSNLFRFFGHAMFAESSNFQIIGSTFTTHHWCCKCYISRRWYLYDLNSGILNANLYTQSDQQQRPPPPANPARKISRRKDRKGKSGKIPSYSGRCHRLAHMQLHIEISHSTMSASARVSNIAIMTTEDELASFFHSKGLPITSRRHLPLVVSADGQKTTVVSFIDEPTLKMALSLPSTDRVLNHRALEFDDGFDGCTVLSAGTQVE